MAKPLYWIVWANGQRYEFRQRCSMRAFVAVQKAMGHRVTTKAVGF